jgi:hypothetical protein
VAVTKIEDPRLRARKILLSRSKPTPAMIKYLEILLNDCGFGTRICRNEYLSNRTGYEIHYLDEITFDEAKSMISELKEQRKRELGY